MLTYFDRQGLPLSRTEWFKRFVDANYGRVERRRIYRNGESWIVEASWVGVRSDIERQPKLFFVSWSYQEQPLTELRVQYEQWCATEKEAQLCFDQWASAILADQATNRRESGQRVGKRL